VRASAINRLSASLSSGVAKFINLAKINCEAALICSRFALAWASVSDSHTLAIAVLLSPQRRRASATVAALTRPADQERKAVTHPLRWGITRLRADGSDAGMVEFLLPWLASTDCLDETMERPRSDSGPLPAVQRRLHRGFPNVNSAPLIPKGGAFFAAVRPPLSLQRFFGQERFNLVQGHEAFRVMSWPLRAGLDVQPSGLPAFISPTKNQP
jgi:hypothetical protein